MNFLSEQIYSLMTIPILLFLSAFFSGSETAIFSLTAYERSKLYRFTRIFRLIEYLLARSDKLLMTILFANLAVNLLIFTISTVLVYRAIRSGFELLASIIGIGALFAVIVFGEILPKAVAYHLRVELSAIVIFPLWIVYRVLEPIVAVLLYVFVKPGVRLIVGTVREKELSKEELLMVLELAKNEKFVAPLEADVLERLVKMRDMKVKQIMIPRVNMLAVDIKQSVEQVKELFYKVHKMRILVYEDSIDNPKGIIRAKRLWIDSPTNLNDILEPITFVPEHQRVDQLIGFMRENRIDIVGVVDEYGILVGVVELKKIYEELLGGIREEIAEVSEPRVAKIGCNEYLIDGYFPFDRFCEQFGVDEKIGEEIETLAGLVLHLKGYLPQEGEVAEWGGFRFIVERVANNRIEKILVEDNRNIGS